MSTTPTKKKKKSRQQNSWKHPKYPARTYSGHYSRLSGERVFVLNHVPKSGRAHNIAFESYQLAKSTGWKKCNR